eukprot:1140858-Pelagomonas_calceolata.AAC.3
MEFEPLGLPASLGHGRPWAEYSETSLVAEQKMVSMGHPAHPRPATRHACQAKALIEGFDFGWRGGAAGNHVETRGLAQCAGATRSRTCELRSCASLVHGLVWFKPGEWVANALNNCNACSNVHAGIIM